MMPSNFYVYELTGCYPVDAVVCFFVYIIARSTLKFIEVAMSVKVWTVAAILFGCKYCFDQMSGMLTGGDITETTFVAMITAIQYIILGGIVPIVTMREIFKAGPMFGTSTPSTIAKTVVGAASALVPAGIVAAVASVNTAPPVVEPGDNITGPPQGGGD
jgi:hypothetical protein